MLTSKKKGKYSRNKFFQDFKLSVKGPSLQTNIAEEMLISTVKLNKFVDAATECPVPECPGD